jgi:hypothetical protein
MLHVAWKGLNMLHFCVAEFVCVHILADDHISCIRQASYGTFGNVLLLCLQKFVNITQSYTSSFPNWSLSSEVSYIHRHYKSRIKY